MLKTASRALTAGDFRELSEGPPYYQLIEGDLYMSPSPNRAHQDILLQLALLIGSYLESHPNGTVHIAPSDVELSELNVYQPDLYYVSNERRRILTEQGATGAPDLVVEILSRKTARLDREVKRKIYARTGVAELWLVDPDRKRIEVYNLAESPDRPSDIYSGRRKISSPLLPGLEIPVAKVFKR